MSDTNNVKEIVSDAVKGVDDGLDPNQLSLEALALLINTERLRQLENKIIKEFGELKSRQDKVSFLHKLIKAINAATNSKGEVDFSDKPEMQTMLDKAREYGVDLKEGNKFGSDDRDRMIENIRMTTEDLNVLNDMQLQSVTRLTNERYESYQMARSIMKPLHDDKINKSRAIAGR